MKLLITGGAGYIGSHMAKLAVRAGHDVVVLDDLSTGHRRQARYGRFVVGRTRDRVLLNHLFAKENFDAVLHFAAFSIVQESFEEPWAYLENNVLGTLTLLEAMQAYGVDSLVFSSTAAVYGNTGSARIKEDTALAPVNPYGHSKAIVEKLLRKQCSNKGLKAISMRYFNACGADPEGQLGELHEPETHLIPLVIQAALGQRESIAIFGSDYATHDGTCVRDYVHVQDLCIAHLLALSRLNTRPNGSYEAFNLGSEHGYSVQQVVSKVAQVAAAHGRSINIKLAERRPGDPASLIADSNKARTILGWQPTYSSLDTIVEHAWAFATKM